MVFVRINVAAANALDTEIQRLKAAPGSQGAESLVPSAASWIRNEAASWLAALPTVVEQRLLEAYAFSGECERLCRQQLLFREAIVAARHASNKGPLDEAHVKGFSLLINVPLSVVEYPQYAQQHCLLIPSDLFRALTAHSFSSMGDALRSFSAGSTPDDCMSLVVCPARLPADASRRAKNDRLIGISEIVSDRAYNKMVAGGNAIHRKVDAAIAGRVAASDEAPAPQKETLAVFMRDVSIGLDMRLMTIAGGIVGYYLCRTRGMETGECIIGAAVGAVLMMFVDAVLLVIRLAKEDLLRRRRPAS